MTSSRKPVLALLCGLLCDDDIWRDVIASMAVEADVRVFSFPNFSSIGDMAEHVLASLQGHFAVAGHSMGGRVALEIVRRSETRVTGIALLNTGVHPLAADEPSKRGRLVALAFSDGMTAVAEEWLPPMLSRNGPVGADLRDRLVAMIERSSPDSFAAQIRALLTRPEAAEVLARLEIPTLLLSAAGDVWSPPAQHEAMRELCPRAELIIIPEGGHMVPVEQPIAVAAALDSWLVRVGMEIRSGTIDAADPDIIRACTQQINRYAQLNDAGAYAELSNLFIEDGMFARPADPHNPIRGRGAIRESFESRPPRRTLHIVCNVRVVVESPTRALATSDVTLISADNSALAAPVITRAEGSFSDVLRRVGNEWLFAERLGKITSRSVL